MQDNSRDVLPACEYVNWEKPRNSGNINRQEPQHSGGDTAWSRCSRLMAVCAALLCVLLLSVAILQSIKLNNMTRERDRLQIRYDSMTSERDKLQKMLNNTVQQCLRYFITKRMDWNKARQECRSRGADLVIINSREEQEYLSQMVTGEAWIGLSDSAEEGKWMWVDNTTATTGFWWQGEPNNHEGNEDCALTGSKFAKAKMTTWADSRCETKLRAICEMKAK
ncbi:CD209 antigen-like protein C [Hemibagrus wyckioides]|uniref:CD209 antigen-like protein C n=1 Tax=Hemibagrus wyckioides TaxID=337641 RepID=UPI00266C9E9D|nr:CD209 antigen-like protein C [Hemibagrus wyckioides]